MRTDTEYRSPTKRALDVIGTLTVECGDLHFELQLTPKYSIANFPSFRMLLRAGRRRNELRKMAEEIAGPSSVVLHFFSTKTHLVYATTGGRPVGKIRVKNGHLNFFPTPIGFFRGIK